MNLLKAKNSIGRDHQKTPAAKGVIRVGTSGIVLPGTKTTFPKEYQSSSRLHYYGSLFNTLEIIVENKYQNVENIIKNCLIFLNIKPINLQLYY
ncbi:MAG: hypothetical protein EOO07_32265, partial [Chitinophagaceae bacterium]